MSGDYSHFDGAHRNKSASAHFGRPVGEVRPSPDSFRKRGTGTMVLPEKGEFSYKTQERKASVPRRGEAPILGLKTGKNYIVSNAVEVILKPAKAPPSQKDYLKKGNYGQVPRYLDRIKGDIEEEYKTLKQLKDEQLAEEERQKFLMTAEEIEQLKNGLKQKWESVSKEYQSITHIRYPDTQGLKRKKTTCEKEMAQIEKDLALLEKPFVFVDTAF
jgi:hypothetical protein